MKRLLSTIVWVRCVDSKSSTTCWTVFFDKYPSMTARSNPNGSMENIAGVVNEDGNVCGMMPHPERCSENILNNQDGLKIFYSIISHWNSKKSGK